MEKNVLILSLGTGRKVAGEYPYDTANYRFEDGDEVIVSPFVAEALIRCTKPDHILIVGTVKSAWGAFYHKYHKEIDNFSEKWDAIEQQISEMNRNSENSDVEAFQMKLNRIYAEELEIKGNPGVEVCLIPYGITETEIKYSYQKISNCLRSLLRNFDENDSINISFDITHSFRSLPVYNLVVIDYCRLLMKQNIRIAHVFYGNLDVARENNDVAQIVDLKDVVNILETTRGISEFQNTGNATSFLNWYNAKNGENDAFIEQLREFHRATQMNNRRLLQSSLEQLLSTEIQGESDALLDAKNTIQEKLMQVFPNAGNIGANAEDKQISKAKFQLALAKWCLEHGQVGLAAAIAKEAFRSFLVVVYEKGTSEYEDENKRKRSEQLFSNRVKEAVAGSVFAQYGNIEKESKEIRNVYAHNLASDESHTKEYQEAEQTIKSYIAIIEKIMSEDRSKFDAGNAVTTVTTSGNKIAILITSERNVTNQVNELSKDHMVIQLNGYYGVPASGKNRRERIKKVSRIITCKIVEIILQYGESSIAKIVWGDDIEESVIQNASCLIKTYICETNVSFLKWSNNKQETIRLDCLWEIDLEKEFNEDIQGDMQSDMSYTNYVLIVHP